MNDYKYYWAYRYVDTKEPAIVLLSDSAYQNDHMAHLAETSPCRFRRNVAISSTRLSEAELGTWSAFKLCPIIRVEENEETAKFMYNTTQTTP